MLGKMQNNSIIIVMIVIFSSCYNAKEEHVKNDVVGLEDDKIEYWINKQLDSNFINMNFCDSGPQGAKINISDSTVTHYGYNEYWTEKLKRVKDNQYITNSYKLSYSETKEEIALISKDINVPFSKLNVKIDKDGNFLHQYKLHCLKKSFPLDNHIKGLYGFRCDMYLKAKFLYSKDNKKLWLVRIEKNHLVVNEVIKKPKFKTQRLSDFSIGKDILIKKR